MGQKKTGRGAAHRPARRQRQPATALTAKKGGSALGSGGEGGGKAGPGGGEGEGTTTWLPAVSAWSQPPEQKLSHEQPALLSCDV